MNTRGYKRYPRKPNEMNKGGATHEKNLPAQEETEKDGARFQKENGDC